jgi:DhnA family fructose-bisphosphate aldolase class Ia
MIIDKQLTVSLAQAVTSSAASTDYIDQGAAGNAIGKELFLVVRVDTTATASGSATVNFQVESDSDSGFATAKVVNFDSGAIGKAALVAGVEIVKIKLPIGLKRYVRVYYTVGTGPLTAGKFDAFLTFDVKA